MFRVDIEHMVKKRLLLVKIFTFIYNLQLKDLVLFLHIFYLFVIPVRSPLPTIHCLTIYNHTNRVFLFFSLFSFLFLFFLRPPLIIRFFQPFPFSSYSLNVCSIQMSFLALLLFSIFFFMGDILFYNFSYDLHGVQWLMLQTKPSPKLALLLHS